MPIPDTVQIGGPLAPTAESDLYPTHLDRFGAGGYRAVADIAARDAIPAARRTAGMLVKLLDTGVYYSLAVDLITWTVVSFGGGITWSVVSSSTTAEAGHGYILDTRVGEVDLTLPASPVVGNEVWAIRCGGAAGQAQGNGQPINQFLVSLSLDNYTAVRFVYMENAETESIGWVASVILTGSQVNTLVGSAISAHVADPTDPHNIAGAVSQGIALHVAELDPHLQYGRKDRLPLNVKDYGAFGDGTSHPLSSVYASLEEAQAVYPEAVDLTDEIDWCAITRCVSLTQQDRPFGGSIFMPSGSYLCNRAVDLSGVINIVLYGDGSIWRNYTRIAPSISNNAGTRVTYTGTSPGALFYLGPATRNGHTVAGNAFRDFEMSSPSTSGNYLIHWDRTGQGFFCAGCYFGGGDKQLYFSGGVEPYDLYFTDCFFSIGTRLSDSTGAYRPNYNIYATDDTYLGSQSTYWSSCTFRFTQISHVRAAACDLAFTACTMEATYDGPSIDIIGNVASAATITLSRVHWEGIWYNAHWNGTYFQVSSSDTARAATILAGGSGAAWVRIVGGSTINLRVPPSLESLYAVRARSAGVRVLASDIGMTPSLSRAFVWADAELAAFDLTTPAGTYQPTNGDPLVAGVTSIRAVGVAGLPTPGWLWNASSTPAYSRMDWTPTQVSAVRALAEYKSIGAAPILPSRVRRDLYADSPSDLGTTALNLHAPFTIGDQILFYSWRGGAAANIGYGTRYGVLIGKNVSNSGDATALFPLVTGPGILSDVGNADYIWDYSTDPTEIVYATPITADRVVRLSTWSNTIPHGARMRVVRALTCTGDYRLTLQQSDGSTDVDMAALRPGQWVEIMHTGATTGLQWRVIGGGPTTQSGDVIYEFRRPLATLGRHYGLRTVAAAETVTALDATDHRVFVTGTVSHTLTLPPCSRGREIVVNNQSTAPVTVQRDGADTINGGIASVEVRAGQSATFFGQLDTDWYNTIPSAHAPTHKNGGSDAIRLDELAEPVDNSTLDATTDRHGLLSKLDKRKLNNLWGTPPNNSDSPGLPGQIATDGIWLYICLWYNEWVRCPVATWAPTAPPENTVVPQLSGTIAFTEVLTSDNGIWYAEGTPVYTYAWFVNGVEDVSLGTANNIVISTDYAEDLVKCQVTCTTEYGAASAFSAEVEFPAIIIPSNTAAPQLSGTAFFDELLSCTTGSWDGTFPTYSYEWYVNTVLDAGLGTASSITVTEALAGKSVVCRVTATNAAGSAYADSNAVVIAWSPALLSDLKAWYDASDSTTVTLVGSKVSQWNDKSGNGLHVTQGTNSLRPTYITAGLNGRNVMRAYLNHMSSAAALSHNGDHSSGTVAKMFVSGSFAVYQMGNTNEAGSVFTGFDPVTVGYRWFARPRGGGAATAAFTENAYAVITHTTSSSLSKTRLWADSTEGTQATASSVVQTNKVMHVFALTDTLYLMNGEVAEVVLYAQTLSDANRQKLEGYLAYKWGQQGNLPSGHPYKSSFPTGT